ncbi:glycosyltransferase family 87 protein [Bradyrhizobium sp. WD16]|uniref:glycosyltransferase family 87 protein n=1 Tax=Bradyrhizobium sp. WD16 TaxID=1521768 RepID=UPI0020A5ADE8|nr:glycosyltransferase family 87 protein [Bradyrhizobium sp. WD16]UTD27744.1 hypothetical protein DB459_13305 [Bradyrhizobium sp. WD16]
MDHLRHAVRTGAWLTRARLRNYSLMLLAMAVAALTIWAAMADRLVDRNGKPLGTDFSSVYAAGALVYQGRATDAYDPARQHAAEKAAFDGREVPFYGWHYPPFFFAVAAAAAALPYGPGLLLWLLLSGTAYGIAIRAIVPAPVPARDVWLAAFAFPAVFVNIGHGQNGFLTAALLAGALCALERRPLLAGALFGLLAYKPQFGILIPIALVAGGHWRVIAAAAAAIAALVGATLITLGSDVWRAFAASTTFTQTIVLEQGGTGWAKIQSLFAAMRMWGAGVPTAYAMQAVLALALASSLAWLWHSRASGALKAAALATACLLATPYVLDYDLAVLGVAIAFLVRHGLDEGFHDGEISLLAAAWTVPLLARGIADAVLIPIGFATVAALYVFTLRRAIFGSRAGLRVLLAHP